MGATVTVLVNSEVLGEVEVDTYEFTHSMQLYALNIGHNTVEVRVGPPVQREARTGVKALLRLHYGFIEALFRLY